MSFSGKCFKTAVLSALKRAKAFKLIWEEKMFVTAFCFGYDFLVETDPSLEIDSKSRSIASSWIAVIE